MTLGVVVNREKERVIKNVSLALFIYQKWEEMGHKELLPLVAIITQLSGGGLQRETHNSQAINKYLTETRIIRQSLHSLFMDL